MSNVSRNGNGNSTRGLAGILVVLLLMLLVGAMLLFSLFYSINLPTKESYSPVSEEEIPVRIVQRQSAGAPLDEEDAYVREYLANRAARKNSRDSGDSDVDLGKGLVLYFDFNERQGSTEFDDSSKGSNSARCSGEACPTSGVAGKFGNGLRFDGADDFLSVGDDSFYYSERALSIAAWVKWESVDSSVSTFVWKSQGNVDCPDLPYCSNREYFFGIWNNSRLHLATTPNSLIGQHQLGIAADYPSTSVAWHHVVGVIDAGNESMKLYIDGRLVQQMHDSHLSSGIRDSDGDLIIGNDFGASGAMGPFAGVMDDLRIYNRVLSVDEIRELAR